MRFLASFTGPLAVVALAGSLAVGAALPAPAQAQDIQITGPLAGQPAVRRMRQYRLNRIQLVVPTVGYTLQDQFSRSLVTGLEANLHFTDFFGIGLYGAMANFGNAFQINTDLTSQVVQNGQTTRNNRLSMPSPEGFADQVARLQGVVSLQAIFAPLRGKLSFFQGAFVDTDFYVFLGFALGFVDERANVEGAAADECEIGPTNAACLATQSARSSRIAPTATFGLGLNLYFNDFLGLAIQYRAFPFNMNASGTDEAGIGGASVSQPDGQINGADSSFYYHHMVNIGLIINLPPEADLSE